MTYLTPCDGMNAIVIIVTTVTIMAVLDRNSCECIKSELDLFTVTPTQTSIEQTRYKEYYPISLTTSNAPLEFHINGTDEEYLDLQQSYLYLSASILSGNGTAITRPTGEDRPTAAKVVFPINYFAATQFKNVEVILSGTQVSPTDVQYAYRAYLETTLSYGDSKKEQLQSSMYYPDAGDPTVSGPQVLADDCPNTGAKARFQKTEYSKTFEMISRIHHSMFNQQKLLLNKVDVRLKFHRHDPKFCLIAANENANYVIHIDKATMMMCHKKVAPSVREAHEVALLKNPAKYNVRTSDVKFFTKSAGSADLSEPNVHTGILPRKVVVGLVSSAAFNGVLNANPLNFAPYDLSSIQLRRNGVSLPYDIIEMDFDNDYVLPGYSTLFQGMGRLFHDQHINITMDDYKRSGFTLYVFDLTQDGTDANLSLLQEGKLSLHIKLGTTSTTSLTIIVYMEKDGLIEIDKDRNVTFEY